jgi:esterase
VTLNNHTFLGLDEVRYVNPHEKGVNMELAYKLWGAQNAELDKIILLHGMGGTGSLWRPIAATIEDHYSILAPDQRAHGRSRASGLTSFTPLDFGQDLIDTMDSIDFHPTWIIGHSMGVRSAAAAAWLKPEWIRGLILVDLGFSGPAGGGLGDNLAQFLKVLPLTFSSRAEAREFMNQHCPDPSMAQYLMAVSVPQADGCLTFPFDKEGLIQTLHAVAQFSVRDWLHELAEKGMPILALRGKESLVWSSSAFEQEKEFFAKWPSMEFQEVANTGHGLPFEKRQEFLSIVLDFMRRHPTNPASGSQG